jgi:hypothetical protein
MKIGVGGEITSPIQNAIQRFPKDKLFVLKQALLRDNMSFHLFVLMK